MEKMVAFLGGGVWGAGGGSHVKAKKSGWTVFNYDYRNTGARGVAFPEVLLALRPSRAVWRGAWWWR